MKKKKIYVDIDKDPKTEIINYILEEYDKDYRKDFKNTEFTDGTALKEIITELKELRYIKIRKNSFSIQLLGIRHLREILFSREQYIESIKIQWAGIILSMTLALISNLIAIYSFESTKMRISLILFELVLLIFTSKTIEKLLKRKGSIY